MKMDNGDAQYPNCATWYCAIAYIYTCIQIKGRESGGESEGESEWESGGERGREWIIHR